MSRCAGTKADGARCRGMAMPGAKWCYAHHPDNSEERKRNASKGGQCGGRGRPAGSGAEGVKEIKDLLADLTVGVLSGEVTREVAIAANQLLNTSLRALELERKWKEALDLEARLEAIEGVLKDRERRQAG
jgi:hypothetical protein